MLSAIFMNKLPIAKTNDCVVQNLNDEILIYNLTDNKAFCLNKTSAIVYQSCDGETTFAELQKQSGFTEDMIHLTISELEKQGFVEIPSDYVSPLNGMSRREAVKKVGLATMVALPVISSVIAPQALNAASGGNLALFQACSSNPQCSSGYCNPTSNGRVCCNTQTSGQGGGYNSPGGYIDCVTSQTECNTIAHLCCSNKVTIVARNICPNPQIPFDCICDS